MKKKNPPRVVTLCNGYDSQCLALKRLQEKHPKFAFGLVAWSGIEESTITARNLLFPEYKES